MLGLVGVRAVPLFIGVPVEAAAGHQRFSRLDESVDCKGRLQRDHEEVHPAPSGLTCASLIRVVMESPPCVYLRQQLFMLPLVGKPKQLPLLLRDRLSC